VEKGKVVANLAIRHIQPRVSTGVKQGRSGLHASPDPPNIQGGCKVRAIWPKWMPFPGRDSPLFAPHRHPPARVAGLQSGDLNVALHEVDRNLLERCLSRQPRAWEDFVDRFMGLVVHVVNHTALARSVRLATEDREDLCAEVFLTIIRHDFALLRHFRGGSSLATYLTVVARRIVVREMLSRKSATRLATMAPGTAGGAADQAAEVDEGLERFGDRDEIDRLLGELEQREAELVRLFHLEGKSYHEIAATTGLSENSLGPMLTRARQKMRRAANQPSDEQKAELTGG